MRVLRSADYKQMPWRNGGGATLQIGIYPEDAGLDDFHWRVSMARVEADGPFSVFPGVDRTLTLLEGNGVVLDVGVRAPVGLREAYDPLPFPGDDTATCSLIEGPVTDLNVMTRRGRASHVVEALQLGTDETAEFSSGNRLIFCASGRFSVDDGGSDIMVDRFDSVELRRDDGMVRATALESSVLLVTELYLKV